ncbi:hypothetical protein J6Q66_07895 [bacterium]|nr:hypothetical protein [bacterium]
MTEVLEQKIEDLTAYIKNMDANSRAEDETYKSILSKILYRLDVLETEENVDVIEIKDRIKFLTAQIEDNDVSNELGNIVRVVDDLKTNQVVEFEQINSNINNAKSFQEETLAKLNEVFEKIENLQLENNDKITDKVNEIKEDLNSVRENTQKVSDFSADLKTDISNTIENIENKFNDIISSQNSAQDDYKDFVSQNLDDIKGQLWETENNIKNALRAQIEEYSNSLDVPNKLDYLVQTMSTINKDASELVGEVEMLKNTSFAIGEDTSSVREYLESTKDDLKNRLRDLQEQFVLQMLQVFDNISFASETEEIIDFVDESSFAIKTELETLKREIDKISSKDDSDFFNEHFNNLCDLVTKQTNTEFNLLKDVAKEIKKITANSESSDEYNYSLPDIENDLAKIRLVLKEIQTEKIAKDEKDIDIFERFEILNEDISSISKRTNKLILTSEDINKKFKSYLDEFKDIIDISYARNRQTFIEQKVDSAIRLIASNAKSIQILNEVFMHFAEWIDATSETLENNGSLVEDANEKSAQALFAMERVISDNSQRYEQFLDAVEQILSDSEQRYEQFLSAIEQVERTISDNEHKYAQELELQSSQINDGIENLSTNFVSRIEQVENALNVLNQKFEEKIDENKELQMTIEKQNKLIVKLEEKIEKFSKVEAKIDDESRTVIEYIASQIGITAENTQDNKDITGKLEFLEHKITSLDKNIQKIISYIDEE